MRGQPFNLHQGKGGVAEVEEEEEERVFWSVGGASVDRKEGGALKEGEPRSVLDIKRRSSSPPTSTSTLSSSLGCGGGGSSDTAGVAAVHGNPPAAAAAARRWLPHPSDVEASPAASAGDVDGKRDDWSAGLQPIPAGMDSGDGADDFSSMFPEPAAASPEQDHTFLRWIMGDIEDPSSGIKHQLLSHLPPPPELEDSDGGGGGFGLVDPGFGFESSGSAGFPDMSAAAGNSYSGGGRINSFNQLPESAPPNLKASSFGNPAAPYPSSPPLSLPPGFFLHESAAEKPQQQLFASNILQSHATQNPAFFFNLPSFAAAEHHHQPPQLVGAAAPAHHTKRHHSPASTLPFPDSCGPPDLFIRRNHPPPPPPPPPTFIKNRGPAGGDEAAAAAQAAVDQLLKAAEMVEAGNFTCARGILARLNHQLPFPVGKPILRSAFYFKEALQLILSAPPPSSAAAPATPLDVILKLSAYKAFSDVSPVLQFTNFTSIQALLEELGAAGRIHIIDFDIGIGGQWSSFMQELAQRRSAAATASPAMLKITAFVDPNAYHPLELHLTRENLTHFAADLCIPFEFDAMSLDSFDPSAVLAAASRDDAAIAVSLSVNNLYSSGTSPPSAALRLMKQLSPKVVIAVDHGGDRGDLPFSHSFLRSFQSSVVVLESIDAAGAAMDVANKIERFILQPRNENAVLGHRHHHRGAGEKTAAAAQPWRAMFASSGFAPLQFSNFTEIQAECLLKRVQVRGFHIEKRYSSLFLCWQSGELVSVSAWRCC